MHSDSDGTKEYKINSTETNVCQVLIGKLDFKHFSEDNSQIKFEFQLSPKIAPYAHLIATIKNKSELFILAGEADLYLNKVFVGTRRLKDCDRNKELKLSFGIERSIHVNYKPIEEKFVKIGIFKRKTSRYIRTIEILNKIPNRKNLLVLDQLENNKEIKVKLLSVKLENVDKIKDSQITDLVNFEFRLEINENFNQNLIIEFYKKKKKMFI